MEARTLVLTKSYTPHQIVSWTSAATSLFTGKYEVIEAYQGDDNLLGIIPASRVKEMPHVARAFPAYAGGDLEVRIPSIARIVGYEGSVKRGIKFSRINVFTRDGFRCQYCGEQKPEKQLNYDHVLPRMLGGRTVWENIVTSCYPCNTYKGHRTPDQAGMKLRRQPYKPKTLPMVGPRFSPLDVHPSWLPYLVNCLDFAGTAAA